MNAKTKVTENHFLDLQLLLKQHPPGQARPLWIKATGYVEHLKAAEYSGP